MATWIIKIGNGYVRYSGCYGVSNTAHQHLATRFATRAAARKAISESAGFPRPRSYRIVRLRTREEKRIDSLSRQVDILFERLGMDRDRGAP